MVQEKLLQLLAEKQPRRADLVAELSTLLNRTERTIYSRLNNKYGFFFGRNRAAHTSLPA
ncbi:MAG: hypothetical protein AAGG68_06870 [Bacteroidota bacterium]